MQPVSAARIACSKVKMVVANVLMFISFNCRHAWRPSQVAGTLMQSLARSKEGCSFRVIACMPIYVFSQAFDRGHDTNASHSRRLSPLSKQRPD